MKTITCLSLLLSFLAAHLPAQGTLQSGPMIGYSKMAETLIWVQTTESAEVVIRYWDKQNPESIFETDPIVTQKDTAFVAKCIADRVKASTYYDYEVWIDGQQVEPQFRGGYKQSGAIPLTFQTPPNWRFRKDGHQIFDFSVGFGSCAYINQDGYNRESSSRPYGAGYEIFESIYEVDPDIFIWLGDNIYLREPDWTSRTGIYQRWTHDRSIPHLRPMLANIIQYATWDDHDYGPNNAGWNFWNKAETTAAFTLFYGNPSAGLPELPGIFTFFNWGDVNFYITDNRTYRTPNQVSSEGSDRPRSLLGREQVDWLVDSMKYRDGQGQHRRSYPVNFNVVCLGNQMFALQSTDNYSHYTEEWDYLITRIIEEGINGVIFLSGDVHYGDVSKRTFRGGKDIALSKPAGRSGGTYTFLDITSSPLTSGSWSGPDLDRNPYRHDIFPGEMDRVGQRNFATMSFTGPLDDRKMAISFYDTEGNLLNQKPDAANGVVTDASIFSARDLRAPQNIRD